MSTVPLPRLIAKAQKVFNAWIRERDKGKACISCGMAKIDHAGHYFAAGQFTALRFNETNVNGQCIQCNYFKHSNAIGYRNGLIAKYGEASVLMLESSAKRAVKKWSRFELESIIEFYSL